MDETVISVQGLGKRFRIGTLQASPDSLIQTIWQTLKSPVANYRKLKRLTRFDKDDETVFWALRNIDFEVRRGEVLGIIGHNGAGKSTLLKILSRITEPTVGEARLLGRVSSLLEVGTGFHPDLTGRENVFMNGTILGMTKKEIDKKFDEILDFSGVEKYVDTPVKFYSSGMKVRLGFAVAAHLEPEILIVDEVLSVGDIGFQRKCIGKMNEVAGSGRTVLFVSHNMAAIENICSTALLLDHGQSIFLGQVKDAVKQYIAIFRPEGGTTFLSGEIRRLGSGMARITSFSLRTHEDQETDLVKTGEKINLCFGIKASQDLENVDLGFSVHREEDEQLLFILYSSYTGKLLRIKSGESTVACQLESLPLPEGRYLVKAQIMKDGDVLDCPVAGVSLLLF